MHTCSNKSVRLSVLAMAVAIAMTTIQLSLPSEAKGMGGGRGRGHSMSMSQSSSYLGKYPGSGGSWTWKQVDGQWVERFEPVDKNRAYYKKQMAARRRAQRKVKLSARENQEEDDYNEGEDSHVDSVEAHKGHDSKVVKVKKILVLTNQSTNPTAAITTTVKSEADSTTQRPSRQYGIRYGRVRME